MKLKATITVPGPILLLQPGQDPPRDAAAIRATGGPMQGSRLYLDGLHAGTMTGFLHVDSESIVGGGEEIIASTVEVELDLDLLLTSARRDRR